MLFIDFLDNIFTNHPVLSIAFSGFGLALIPAIFCISKKIWASHKHSNSQTFTSEIKTNIIFSQPEQTNNPSKIESDIKTIENSIKFDLSSNQKNVFLRYFNKYKNQLNKNDVGSLYKQLTLSSTNYSSLLSQLLGLIEALNKK